MSLSVQRLHHLTLACADNEVEQLREFYQSVLGLTVGWRPPFDLPGYWLYADGSPIVHILATGKVASSSETHYDHAAFLASNLKHTRAFLQSRQISFVGSSVPGTTLYQIHLHDPVGVKLELTFDMEVED
jgi:catechol 2,3-dioxygenase-like lactoylglutathione lyase family enzyme